MNRMKMGVVILALCRTVAVRAATLEVGAGKAYSDIQTAIDAAIEGTDEVLVYDGVYNTTVQVSLTKAVTVRSVNGRDRTAIRRTDRPSLLSPTPAATDAGCVYRVLSIDNPNARVEGFSISGGYVSKTSGEYGAGVRIGTTGGTLCDCVVSNNLNRQVSYGGGVAVLSGAGVVTNCLITRNISMRVSAAEGDTRGCGIYMTGGLITHSQVSDNNIPDTAITVFGGPGMYGAGVYMADGRISHCRIAGNMMGTAGNNGRGGGVYAQNGAIDNSLIAGNRAQGNNTTDPSVSGGGVYVEGVANKTVSLVNCTIVNNTAPNKGGVYTYTTMRLVNTVIFGNTATTANSPEFTSTSDSVMSNCLSSVAFPNPKQVACQTVSDAKLDAEYKPFPDSPCVNNGWDGALGGLAETDLAGEKRKDGPAVDIGCYEYQVPAFTANVVFSFDKQIPNCVIGCTAIVQTVSTEVRSYRWKLDDGAWSEYDEADGFATTFATPGDHIVQLQVRLGNEPQTIVSEVFYVAPAVLTVAADGSADYTEVATAIAAARDGSEIRVKPGPYDFEGQLTVSDAINLVGIEGAAATFLHRTDGIAEDGVVKRVVLIDNPRAVVRGFTISGGYVFNVTGGNGAGACIGSQGGLLADCVVTCNTNRAASYGGGVALMSAAAVVSNCLIRGNCLVRTKAAEETAGGGVYLANGLVIDCDIVGNTGNGCNGMGVYAMGGRLTRCRVNANQMGTSNRGQGAGLFVTGNGTLVDNCLICCNTNNDTQAGGKGGGVYLSNGARLVNCTVSGNQSINVGGVYSDSALAVAANCVVQDNGVLFNAEKTTIAETNWYGNAQCSYSLVSDALPTGAGNLQATAVFVPGTFILKANRPGWKAASSAQYEVYVGPLAGAQDIDGNARSAKTRHNVALMDMGCSESPWQDAGLMVIVR